MTPAHCVPVALRMESECADSSVDTCSTGCWDCCHRHQQSINSVSIACPNCRGAGIVQAVWRFIGDGPATQQVGGTTAGNLLEATSFYHRMDTPRSQEDVQPTPGGHPVSYGPAPDVPDPALFVNNHSYHIQTRLANGQPSLLVDPGSVGNLCGYRWAKEVAQHAARNNRQPSYNKRNRSLRVWSGQWLTKLQLRLQTPNLPPTVRQHTNKRRAHHHACCPRLGLTKPT